MSAHRRPSAPQRAAWRGVRVVRWMLRPAFVAFLRLGDYLPAPGRPMSGRLVVIGCGATKRGQRAPAAELYAGSYFRSCLAAALAIAPRSSVLIVSALHGLVELDRELDPYDMILGAPEAITAAELGHQAAALGVAGLPVVALCPAAYADLLAASGAFPEVSRPLAGLGIGQQRGRLRELRLQDALW